MDCKYKLIGGIYYMVCDGKMIPVDIDAPPMFRAKGGYMEIEKLVKIASDKEADKFKHLRQHINKEENPNAKKLLKKIEELIQKGNEARAQVLMSRYKRRYA